MVECITGMLNVESVILHSDLHPFIGINLIYNLIRELPLGSLTPKGIKIVNYNMSLGYRIWVRSIYYDNIV